MLPLNLLLLKASSSKLSTSAIAAGSVPSNPLPCKLILFTQPAVLKNTPDQEVTGKSLFHLSPFQLAPLVASYKAHNAKESVTLHACENRVVLNPEIKKKPRQKIVFWVIFLIHLASKIDLLRFEKCLGSASIQV